MALATALSVCVSQASVPYQPFMSLPLLPGTIVKLSQCFSRIPSHLIGGEEEAHSLLPRPVEGHGPALQPQITRD